jgi:hypothetical protein
LLLLHQRAEFSRAASKKKLTRFVGARRFVWWANTNLSVLDGERGWHDPERFATEFNERCESGDHAMRTFARKPLSWAKLDTNVRAAPGDQEELRRLGESYKKRSIHPLIAKLDGTMVDGTRRVIGLGLIGEKDAEFLLTDEDLKPEDIIEIGLITAMHRSDLTGYEKWQGCLKILALHPGWLGKDLAAHLNIDPSMIARLMAASNTVTKVQEAFKAGAINGAQVYAISKAGPEEQLAMLAAALDGAGRTRLENAGRKARNGEVPGIKVNRLRIPLGAQGRSVTIAGNNLSLFDAIEILQDTLKFARKAQGENLDGKTWVQVMKDKAKAGA